MSLKKFKKVDRDSWRPVLTIALESEVAKWSGEAAAAGLSVNQWIRQQLTKGDV